MTRIWPCACTSFICSKQHPATAWELDAGIPARGWHGEGYRGHIFWDELFIFPFLNLHLPILAGALLLYQASPR